MYPHLMAEEVAVFVEGRVARSRSRALTIHLLGCAECFGVFQRRHSTKGEQRLAEMLGLPAPPGEWPTHSARCAREIAEKDPGLAQWAELEGLPSHEKSLRLRNLPRPRVTAGLVMAVLQESKKLWHESATQAADLARVALELVLQLQADGYPWPALLADLAAEGLGYLGNAERIQGDLRSAEPKLRSAILLLLSARSRNVELLGVLLWLWANVRRDAEDYSLAHDLLDSAESCFQTLEASGWLATIELYRANLLAGQGDLTQSNERLQRLIRSERYSSLAPLVKLSVVQSLATGFTETGQFFKARKLLPQIERLAAVVGGELNQLKVQWLRARSAVGTNQRRAAEILYCEVRDRWVELEHSMDAALVTLELAELYLAWGRPREARDQALVVLEVCRSLEGMRREELEAIATLARAEEDHLERALASLRSLVEASRSPARRRASS